LWRETQTDRLRFACKVLQLLLLIFFFDFEVKKKATNIVACVCVLSYLLCAVLWRLAKKCCPVLAFCFESPLFWSK
jgi:hypothetical protein